MARSLEKIPCYYFDALYSQHSDRNSELAVMIVAQSLSEFEEHKASKQ